MIIWMLLVVLQKISAIVNNILLCTCLDLHVNSGHVSSIF